MSLEKSIESLTAAILDNSKLQAAVLATLKGALPTGAQVADTAESAPAPAASSATTIPASAGSAPPATPTAAATPSPSKAPKKSKAPAAPSSASTGGGSTANAGEPYAPLKLSEIPADFIKDAQAIAKDVPVKAVHIIAAGLYKIANGTAGLDGARKLLKSFEAERASDIKLEKLPEVLTAIKAALAPPAPAAASSPSLI